MKKFLRLVPAFLLSCAILLAISGETVRQGMETTGGLVEIVALFSKILFWMIVGVAVIIYVVKIKDLFGERTDLAKIFQDLISAAVIIAFAAFVCFTMPFWLLKIFGAGISAALLL